VCRQLSAHKIAAALTRVSNPPAPAPRQDRQLGLVSNVVSFTSVRDRSPTAARGASAQVADFGGHR